ncbi:MAG: CBS domain-containing protein [Gemmatimonadales bacterium]
MKVAELMRTNLKTVNAQDSVDSAVTVLADAHISGLPVVDERERLVGVITSTDVLNALAESRAREGRGGRLSELQVEDIMTGRPATIEPGADVLEVARRMLYLEVKRLFVEQDGKLVGVLSQTDIVGALAAGKL